MNRTLENSRTWNHKRILENVGWILLLALLIPLKAQAEPSGKIHILALGDNLYHMGLIESGVQTDGSRDYSFEFETIRPFLDEADIKIINQETVFGGDELGFSGYPRFNCPQAVGDAIAEAGFNVVLHATNHSNDKGVEGLIHCVDYMNEHYPKILTTGGFGTEPRNEDTIPTLKIKGYTFAILNYTYGVNEEVFPKNLEGHLNLLCDYNEKSRYVNFKALNPQVLEDIARAEKKADFTIVCPHWGNEYQTHASHYQEEFAKQMVEAGADLIIGAHPHIVQPVAEVTADNGNTALCYYSLGNYISTQRQSRTMLEAMAYVTLEEKDGHLELIPEESGALPLVCQYQSGPTRFQNIYLLDRYTQKLASVHGINVYDRLRVSDLQTWADDMLGEWRRTSTELFSVGLDGERGKFLQ